MHLLSVDLIKRIENLFKATFARTGTEDRFLVYRSETGEILPVYPQGKKTAVSLENDLPLTIIDQGVLYDLVYDFHSHHEMEIDWSPTDDAEEQIRGVTFGVFSWKDSVDAWGFRRFTGQGYQILPYEQVVQE